MENFDYRSILVDSGSIVQCITGVKGLAGLEGISEVEETGEKEDEEGDWVRQK